MYDPQSQGAPNLQGGMTQSQLQAGSGTGYIAQPAAPESSQVLQPTTNPYSVPQGPSAQDIAYQQEQQRQAGIRSGINADYSSWMDRSAENERRVNEAQGRAIGQVDQNYNFQLGQGQSGYDIGNQNLGSARGRVQENRRNTFGDLISNLRTSQDAGQVQLGAYGAGDSSAVDMMAMGYGRAATTANQDIQRQVGQQSEDIRLQQVGLDTEWQNTQASLNNWKQNQLFSISESVRNQMQAIADERQTASAARQQALNSLEQSVIQNAMQQAGSVQQNFNLSVSGAPEANGQRLAAVNYSPTRLNNNFSGGLAMGSNANNGYGGSLAVRRPDEY